ncbi:MAG: discoidin domain-containing protein, partial [Bacteroides sp.]
APVNKHLVSTGELTEPIAQITEENTEAYQLTPTWTEVPNADYYEIASSVYEEGLGDLYYTTIKDTKLLFDNLQPETDYSFKIRAVNKEGYSAWSSFQGRTLANPLEFAIPNIQATSTAKSQGGNALKKLFDFDESNLWHTKWQTNSVPFDIIMDLKTINQLDKFEYLPRIGGGNGTLLKGQVYYSYDKENWIDAGSFSWTYNDEVKTFSFKDQPSAQYIKLAVTEGIGGFGSGRELYVFKVPHTESYIPGDINNDGKIDINDFTSYTNYTGLRKGDGDFDGYISKGDINRNNLIDAYDISVAATQLDGGITERGDHIAGRLNITTAKQNYKAGEVLEIAVKGSELKGVNALSFALPYEPTQLEFMGVETAHTLGMENLCYDRLHTNGEKVLYPTFVNLGEKELISGSKLLFTLKFKVKQNIKFDLKVTDGFLVDRMLNTLSF